MERPFLSKSVALERVVRVKQRSSLIEDVFEIERQCCEKKFVKFRRIAKFIVFDVRVFPFLLFLLLDIPMLGNQPYSMPSPDLMRLWRINFLPRLIQKFADFDSLQGVKR